MTEADSPDTTIPIPSPTIRWAADPQWENCRDGWLAERASYGHYKLEADEPRAGPAEWRVLVPHPEFPERSAPMIMTDWGDATSLAEAKARAEAAMWADIEPRGPPRSPHVSAGACRQRRNDSQFVDLPGIDVPRRQRSHHSG